MVNKTPTDHRQNEPDTRDEDALAAAYDDALALEKKGMFDKAALLYRRCLEIDPTDRCGASVRIASMGMGDAPPHAPDAYVATLSDQHAEAFDTILTGDLGYMVPMQLASWMNENAPGPYARMLDLGCGTGLSGMMLQEICEHATGVDLSENMIDLSDERACYDDLFVNEAVHFLEEWAKREDPSHLPFDLIVATDVLPYIGALEPFFDGIRANSTKNARIAFSSETLAPEVFSSGGWSITKQQRYAHSAGYLRQMCERAGFSTIELFADITVRTDRDVPLPGFLVVASN